MFTTGIIYLAIQSDFQCQQRQWHTDYFQWIVLNSLAVNAKDMHNELVLPRARFGSHKLQRLNNIGST